MARPQKNGLDYYPQDTTSDRKWKLFKAKYGLAGIGLLTELFKVIYGEGYFYLWDEEAELLFAAENGIQENTLKTMVSYAIEKGIFDRTIFEKYSLLTSKGIQKRFFEACWKRAAVNIFPEIMLIDPKKPEYSRSIIEEKSLADYMIEERSENEVFSDSKTMVSDSETYVLDSETGVSDIIYSQSKVKKSKGKEINIAPTAAAEPKADLTSKIESLPAIADCQTDQELYKSVQARFLDKQLNNRFSNYAKEGKAIKELIKKAKGRNPSDPGLFLEGMISRFEQMREDDDWYRKQPFVPSALNAAGIFDRVLTEAENLWREEQQRHELDYEDEEIIF